MAKSRRLRGGARAISLIPDKLLEFFRSLTFGGLVGIGIAVFIYVRYKAALSGIVEFKIFASLGCALGTIAHRGIDRTMRAVFGPVGRFIADYEKFVELAVLRQRGLITEDVQKEIMNKLVRQRFLGK
jgi:hypothetical protein